MAAKKLLQRASAVVFLAASLAVAVPAPAEASTWDRFAGDDFGGWYHSAEEGCTTGDSVNYVGYHAVAISGSIEWSTGSAHFHMDRLEDSCADGKAARLQVHWFDPGRGVGDIDTWAASGGAGDWRTVDKIYSRSSSTEFEISVRVCNGINSSGSVINCGSWHGPFHQY